ncbi:MAG: class I SAM-dependent methyltransferase, partial [Cyanobacteria bacterium K_DeepCast_35m_m2_023]|nr:class I SAM-dependent methyltransferase [Cyanobacteria bacterium K_DeepCast_35m_m2_023]
CGANQAAVIAYTNPGARVVGIDVSQPSLDHHRWLQQQHGLSNLELQCLPIEALESLERRFDLIISTGVVHHLADPVQGLKALGTCLNPDGVIALMLYARYGRSAVEMMQGVFRDLGLGRDGDSVETVKQALAVLPHDHPLRTYFTIAPDLAYDAGLVDTFLHDRDQSYSVDDCLGLVRAAGLVFQDWFLKAPYYPLTPLQGGTGRFWEAVADLPLAQQWSVMERINTRNACHYFLACRPERPCQSHWIDFNRATAWDYVPSFRYRCGVSEGQIVSPGWTLPLESWQAGVLELIDAQRSIAAIASHQDVSTTAEVMGLVQSLWQWDVLAMGIPA